MKRLGEIILFSTLVGIQIAGCQSEISFQDYEDLKKKGEQVFLQDLQDCSKYADQNLKRTEGSIGAGEEFNQKRNLIRICMERNDWTLKQ